ncbi:MAG TPA: hypothetical protein VHO48_00725 [Anaerolineaceae bacterium]|nr:hypothetical protein [Anaerolineaceae bacterium]
MISIEKVDLNNKEQVNRFIQIPFRLYANHPQWVPPFISDIKVMMNPAKHPFYEHSAAEFYIARADGRDVGRIAALENTLFNKCHETKDAEFYLFDCEDDQDIANTLFERAFEWARNRGCNKVVGPKGFSAFDGYGIQVEGFEHRQMMNMMNYNYPYYSKLVENLGFEKEVDFVSCYLDMEKVHFPDKVHLAAEKILKRGTFWVKRFTKKSELVAMANEIGQAYNNTFINNWEYYPFTKREIKFILDNLLTVADPRLIKIIMHKERVVGFLLAFPDVSTSMQRGKGKLNPLSIYRLFREMRTTRWVSLNGAGILPEFQGIGGNLLLYSEMEKTVRDYNFKHADLTQVAETAKNLRQDLINVGGEAYKNHRVYRRSI